jgi:hypothetical protein
MVRLEELLLIQGSVLFGDLYLETIHWMIKMAFKVIAGSEKPIPPWIPENIGGIKRRIQYGILTNVKA